jgi:hypothetical protein
MNIKALCFSAVAAITIAVSAQSAEAKTRIIIGLGQPGYCDPFFDDRCDDYQPYPVYRFYHRDRERHRDHIIDPYRLTCKDARWMLDEKGFDRVRATSCGGKYHVFKALRDGEPVIVKVRANSGRIVSVNYL